VAKYAPVNLTEEARSALRRCTLNASAAVGRRLTLSEVLVGLATVADRHPDELTTALAPADQDGATQ